MKKRHELASKHSISKPIFLKIAPDLDDNQLQDICQISLTHNIDALIISNTTISRTNIPNHKHHNEAGGLSGKPLFSASTKVLNEIYKETSGKVPLIGVGGISSAQDAYDKILSGASLVQLYTALIYQGFGLVDQINNDLAKLLDRDGFQNISEAIGRK